MIKQKNFDVIIVGGSYSGLAAAMALGRALRDVLVIDSGEPCNEQTPYSHNFLTQDGQTPQAVAVLAKQQVQEYKTVRFLESLATGGAITKTGFEIAVASGEIFAAGKLIFATGIRDIMPGLEGFAACWGISVLHCPYCHGYEVRNQKTGIWGNGDVGFELARLISNWTNELTLFTNGFSTLTAEQTAKLQEHDIRVVEAEFERLIHTDGQVRYIVFKDDTMAAVNALYAPRPFKQTCPIPESMGCALTDDGYVQVDAFQKTTVNGIYACGDNTNRMRTLVNAVATGTTAGMMVNKEIVAESF